MLNMCYTGWFIKHIKHTNHVLNPWLYSILKKKILMFDSINNLNNSINGTKIGEHNKCDSSF